MKKNELDMVIGLLQTILKIQITLCDSIRTILDTLELEKERIELNESKIWYNIDVKKYH